MSFRFTVKIVICSKEKARVSALKRQQEGNYKQIFFGANEGD
jgi:hypothetical protein